MIVSEIKLFELLKAKIGEREAEAFVDILETHVDKKFEEARTILATKEDLAKLEAKLTMRMFLFTVGQIIVIIASLIGIVQFMIK